MQLPHWFREDPDHVKALTAAEADKDHPRLDYVLQSSSGGGMGALMVMMAMYNAHGVYWDNKDVALFILHKLTGYTPVANTKGKK